MWAWTSTRPGRSDTSPRSCTRWVEFTSRESSRCGTTAWIRPASVSTAWSLSHPDTDAFATRLALNTERSATTASLGMRRRRTSPARGQATFRSDEGRQRVTDLAGRSLASEVPRHGLAIGDHRLDGPHDRLSRRGVPEVPEQHGAGPDLGDRHRHPRPRNVRRRAVHRVEPRRWL